MMTVKPWSVTLYIITPSSTAVYREK